MDLDDEELEATRKLNGVAKSNIEEDIKYVKECLKIARVFFKQIKAETDYKEIDDVAFFIAIDNILAERKQDKARIKELEEQVKNEIKGRDILAKLNEDSIPKQKVKDILQNNRNELFSITYVEPIQYKPFEMQVERINKIETELLEESK